MAATESSDSEIVSVPSPTDLAAYTARLQSAIIAPTRLASSLPLGSSLAYERTLDRTTAKELDAVSGRILNLVDRLVGYAGGKGKGKALSADDLLDGRSYRSVVGDVLDQLLENADTCLDEFAGRNKAPAIAVNVPPHRLDPSLLHAAHLPKPQLKFHTPPDNTPLTTPYVPIPHPNPHPYANSPPPSLLKTSPPSSISAFEDTPFTFVENPAQLASMIASLTDKDVTEIAVDLEHHSLRTYKGLVCLIQISTRTQDWVVDALALRDELVALGEVLGDPRIVKVFHGAESDVVWLQRDFGLHVVGLFDTFHASKILGFPKHSLAALLARYTDFIPDKRYQLADWRIRPLPEEMLHYARADTHYLLHIYDQLRNALLEHSQTYPPLPPTPVNGTPPPDAPIPTPSSPRSSDYPWAITRVLARSATTAGRLYIPEVPDPTGLAKRWDLQLGELDKDGRRSRSGSPSDGAVKKRPVEQKAAVFEAVFWWRDKVARAEDESPVYVLANTALFQIATHAPTTMPALSKAVPRLSGPARQHTGELIEAVVGAVERSRREEAEWAEHLQAEEKRRKQEEEREQERQAMVVDVDVAMVDHAGVDLWSRLSSEQKGPVKLTRTSALFGSKPAVQQSQSQPKQKATHSALFGRRKQSPTPILVESAFNELRNRIHGAISDAPRVVAVEEPVQQPPPTEPALAEPAESPPSPEPSTSQPAQPTFLKPQLRSDLAPESDDIVPVAQPRSRSKRRKPPAPDSASGLGSKKARVGPEVESTLAFDYASAPNILDQDDDAEGGSKGRKKERKKGTFLQPQDIVMQLILRMKRRAYMVISQLRPRHRASSEAGIGRLLSSE
ncbi:exosome nuclease subunit [Ceratobasidium sp. 370]|nr:exosome nuclease subunit [Ceratobasidium sp. 370]